MSHLKNFIKIEILSEQFLRLLGHDIIRKINKKLFDESERKRSKIARAKIW